MFVASVLGMWPACFLLWKVMMQSVCISLYWAQLTILGQRHVQCRCQVLHANRKGSTIYMCKLCENDYNLLTGASYSIASQDQIIRAHTCVPYRSLGTQQTNVLTPSIAAATRIGTCKSKHSDNLMHAIPNSSSEVIVHQIWRQVGYGYSLQQFKYQIPASLSQSMSHECIKGFSVCSNVCLSTSLQKQKGHFNSPVVTAVAG